MIPFNYLRFYSLHFLLFLVFILFIGHKQDANASHKIPDYESRAAKIWSVDATLLDTLCRFETRKWAERIPRNENHRKYLESKRNNAHNWLHAVGRCQIRIITAADLLGLDSNNIRPKTFDFIRRVLLDPYINTYFAAWVLSLCIERNKNKGYRNYLERGLVCYNEGPRKKWEGPTLFSKNILHKYSMRKLDHFYIENSHD